MRTSKDYIGKTDGCDGAPFERFNCIGYTSIKVLPELNGKPWNDAALGYVHSLRPSDIRVSKDWCLQCSFQAWRVTVYLKKDGETIEMIKQQVEVGLPDGCNNATHLGEMLSEK
jgi:hypothetical protein